MEVSELLVGPQAVMNALRAGNKKQLLLELSARAAAIANVHERQIFDVLLERERLGSTGVGGGVAIPHGKLGPLTRLHGVFARLVTPVDFGAIDERPIDLVFLLLAPEQAGADHLKALARISRLLRDRVVVEKLRATETADALYALLIDSVSRSHAA